MLLESLTSTIRGNVLPTLFNFTHSLFGLLFQTRPDDDIEAQRCELTRNFKTNASIASGDQNGFHGSKFPSSSLQLIRD